MNQKNEAEKLLRELQLLWLGVVRELMDAIRAKAKLAEIQRLGTAEQFLDDLKFKLERRRRRGYFRRQRR